MFLFFFTGISGVFGTQLNIYDGAFLAKKVNSIDFWLGSKYGSWQCWEKKAF